MRFSFVQEKARAFGTAAKIVPWLCLAGFLSGCTRFDVLNATIPTCTYTRATPLAYGDVPRQKLDIYRPRALRPDAKPGAKVVVFFYGGDWQAGQKGDYRFVAEALASRGFVAVLPDYRLYPHVTFPKFVEDGALAVRWVHDHIDQFGGDPHQVYLMGHSAGAHIAALLTLDPHYLAAVGLEPKSIRATVTLSGPFDFLPGGTEREVFGMKPGDLPDPNIEPIHFANGRSAPMLLVQGQQDDVVIPDNATKLAAAIRRAGGRAEVLSYGKLGHAGTVLSMAWSFRWLAPVLRDTAAFINAH